jgi:hypothetical protein
VLRLGIPVVGLTDIDRTVTFWTAAEQQTEVARLLDLGATAPDRYHYPPDPDFVVLADPDGNLFCVVDLSRAPSGPDTS